LAGITKGSTLPVFTANAYSKGFKITVGADKRVGGSLFYNNDSAKALRHIRQLQSLASLKKIRYVLAITEKKFQNRKKELEDELSLKVAYTDELASWNKDFDKLEKEYQAVKDTLLYYDKIKAAAHKEDLAESMVQDEMSSLEVSKIKDVSYSIKWFSLSASFENSDYNLFDTSVAARLKQDTIHKDYYRRFSGSVSFNYVRNIKKYLLYLYGGLTLKNSFALEDVSVKNNALTGTTNKLVEVDGAKLLNVSSVNNTFNTSYFNPVFETGGFLFFGKEKKFGFEGFAAMSVKSNVPEGIEYRPSFSLRLGPLFSLSNTDGFQSNGTIGLMISVENYTANQSFADYLTFGVRLGVPFNRIKL
jgi:hypothetical protein